MLGGNCDPAPYPDDNEAIIGRSFHLIPPVRL